jgi:hypothetical protein
MLLNEISSDLLPIKGIKDQIDLVPDTMIPNWPAYRSNPKKKNKETSKASWGVDVKEVFKIKHEFRCCSSAICA